LSAAAAVLYGQSHMRPLPVPSAEVGARAKRDLAPGETLDAIGEYCYRGFALSRADALAFNALPLGLAQGASVTRKIAQGRLPHVRELRARRAPADRPGPARAGRVGADGAAA
jgi:predicted homoserine dehydrogenase-like protein